MDIHRPGLSIKIISPDMAEKLVSGKYDAFVLYQVFQNFKFFQCLFHRTTVFLYFMPFHQNGDRTAVQFLFPLFLTAPP